MYALHFGILPTAPGFTPSIYGHDDPAQSETLVDLSWIDPERVDPKAYVSGSWACWGPDDQETDGDNSLHVVVYVTEVTPDLARRLGMALEIGMSTESRLVDHAIVSASDWSQQSHVVLFRSNPPAVLLSTDQIGAC